MNWGFWAFAALLLSIISLCWWADKMERAKEQYRLDVRRRLLEIAKDTSDEYILRKKELGDANTSEIKSHQAADRGFKRPRRAR
jgi:hypothetical protein